MLCGGSSSRCIQKSCPHCHHSQPIIPHPSTGAESDCINSATSCTDEDEDYDECAQMDTDYDDEYDEQGDEDGDAMLTLRIATIKREIREAVQEDDLDGSILRLLNLFSADHFGGTRTPLAHQLALLDAFPFGRCSRCSGDYCLRCARPWHLGMTCRESLRSVILKSSSYDERQQARYLLQSWSF